jgi:hypothetical protein
MKRMKANTSSRVILLIVSIATFVFLGVGGVVGWVKYLHLRVRVAVAEQQTRYFQDFVEEAAQASTPEEVLHHIAITESYSPSLIKVKEGSNLDRIVDRTRWLAISNMQYRAAQLERK